MSDHDVVAIGNAIVDIIARCDDAFLAREGLHKGSMLGTPGFQVKSLRNDAGFGRLEFRADRRGA